MKKYDDIIALPHHVSEKHPQISMIDRAAQFSPFAALTGYGDAIDEAARVTDERIELDEDERRELERKLRETAEAGTTVEITYFVPDDRKEGGAYEATRGTVKKIDLIGHCVVMDDGKRIEISDITGISG